MYNYEKKVQMLKISVIHIQTNNNDLSDKDIYYFVIRNI